MNENESVACLVEETDGNLVNAPLDFVGLKATSYSACEWVLVLVVLLSIHLPYCIIHAYTLTGKPAAYDAFTGLRFPGMGHEMRQRLVPKAAKPLAFPWLRSAPADPLFSRATFIMLVLLAVVWKLVGRFIGQPLESITG